MNCTFSITVALAGFIAAASSQTNGILRADAGEVNLQGASGGRLSTSANGELTAIRWTTQQIELNAPGICAINGSAGRYFWVGLIGNRLVTTSTGAGLSQGGVWENACDKHRKTDFETVDSAETLSRLAALPLRRWRYTNEADTVRHLGPTAQEFRAAFGLGTDDKSIGTVDADGVALAAIQGLNKKIEEDAAAKDAKIQSLEQRIAELEHLIVALPREGR